MQDAEENHDFFIGSRNKKIFIAKIYGFLRVWTLTTGVKLENEKRKLPHNKSKHLSYPMGSDPPSPCVPYKYQKYLPEMENANTLPSYLHSFLWPKEL